MPLYLYSITRCVPFFFMFSRLEKAIQKRWVVFLGLETGSIITNFIKDTQQGVRHQFHELFSTCVRPERGEHLLARIPMPTQHKRIVSEVSTDCAAFVALNITHPLMEVCVMKKPRNALARECQIWVQIHSDFSADWSRNWTVSSSGWSWTNLEDRWSGSFSKLHLYHCQTEKTKQSSKTWLSDDVFSSETWHAGNDHSRLESSVPNAIKIPEGLLFVLQLAQLYY